MAEIGERLGPYEIVERIGSGGMGVVFRARDTRLDRSVAIKILPAEFASSPHSRARFEREAKILSQLTHPNICVVHDIGELAGEPANDGSGPVRSRYIVMEYLDGESLAQRLTKGPLPIDQVLRYGAQIADALEKAHRSGIVHRDIKPGNVLLTRSGAKLLDFGLAKETSAAHEAPHDDTGAATEQVPITQEGRIVGTFSYMAPEQLEGLEVDARTDVFAFGALLYEMATGRRAFEGMSKISLIAAIASGQPRPMHELQPMTPPALEHLILRCLEKHPDDRWQSAHDIRVDLEWLGQSGSRAGLAAPLQLRRRLRRRFVVALLATLAAVAVFWGVLLVRRSRTGVASLVAELTPISGERYMAVGNAGGPAVISPDGRWIVYGARKDGAQFLWVRSIETGESKPIPGTEGGNFPFWAPDSRRIGYFGDEGLRRVDRDGGTNETVASAGNGRGGTWNADGTIVFTPDVQAPLHRVNESGGSSIPLTRVEPPYTTHRWPSFLPDGRHFLFFAADHRNPAGAGCAVFVASLDDPTPRLVISNSSNGVYANGRLLFVRDRILWAQPVTVDGTLSGVPKLVARDVLFDPDVWRAGFSISRDGRLVVATGDVQVAASLLWLDRTGATVGELGTPDKYWEIAVAPDGNQAALSIGDPQRQLWIADIRRHTRSRLTLDFLWTGGPIWSLDGRSIYFTALDQSSSIIVRQSLGGGTQAVLARIEGLAWPAVVSADESELIVSNESKGDLVLLRIGASANPEPFIADPQSRELQAVGSPDGKWVAYCSNETGTYEVYIARISDPTIKYQVSRGGGRQPRWRSDHREFYFVDPSGTLMAIPVDASREEIVLGEPGKLFQVSTTLGMSATRLYAPTADGQRFLVIRPIEPEAPLLRLVTDWERMLREE